jgi:hypothetical protein
MLPNVALLLSAGMDTCACGMKRGCFCKLLAAREGAHCDKKGGGCSMKSVPQPDATPLLASLDLRGWLPGAAVPVEPGAEPAGSVLAGVFPLPAAPTHLPPTPPPRLPFRA